METRKTFSLLLILLILLLAACGSEPAPEESPATAPTTSAESSAENAEQPEESEEGADEADEEESGADSSLPEEAVTYTIVSDESTARYIVDEEFFEDALSKYGIGAGDQETVGSTSAINGEFTLNWNDLEATPLGTNEFTVDLSTLESDQGLRDRWIRNNGPEFNTYPTATFVAETLEGAPSTYSQGETVEFQMVGEITIREITQPATFNVSASLSDGTVTGTASTMLTLTDFEIEPPNFANTLVVQDDFRIEVDFVARAN